jgi:ribose/xylose/arabinose/galactoside ABC-type transport system permease subunit
VVLSIATPNFLEVRNLTNIVLQSAVIGIAAVGMTFVIVTAGIDLSVGSTVALAGMVAAIAMQGGAPGIAGLAVALGVGILVGAFNGFAVTVIGVTPFIVTLATLAMGRGLTLAVSNGQTVFGFPASFTFFGQGSLLGLSFPVFLTLLIFLIGYLVLGRSVFGHQVYAVGGNREAARLAGVPVRRVTFLVYVIAGLCAGVSGIVLTGRLNSALPSSAVGLELDVIAAVVIGGTSLFGGRGSMFGTLIGVLLIGTLRNGLTLLNVDPFWVQFIQGVVIFLAVTIDALNRRREGAVD